MTLRPAALLLLVCLAPAAVPGTARAQGRRASSGDAATKAARARFQEGVRLFDKGQYEAARAAFLKAYALHKHPAVLLNIGQSSLRSGHTMEAVKELQQFLKDSPAPSAAQRDAANGGIAQARARLGQVEVDAPAGADISLDGERVGTAPLADAPYVEPGAHAVKARGDAGVEVNQSVTVRAGQKATAKIVFPAPPPVVAASTPVVPPSSAADVSGAGSSSLADLSGTGPDEKKADGAHGSGPRTWVPVAIGGVIAAVGLGGFIGFGVARASAQSKADQTDKLIRTNGGSAGTCSATDSTTVNKFGKACAILTDNRNTVDSDAKIANISLVVGVVGAATGLGWYLFAPRAAADAPHEGHETAGAVVRPLLAPGLGGMAISGRF